MGTAIGPAARTRLAVIGDVAVDYYLMLPQRQSADEKVTAAASLRLPGGTGANAAAAAAALGSLVTLYSAVGTDRLGDWLLESLKCRGVDTTGVRTLTGTTTQATILVHANGRQVIVDRGIADQLGALDPLLIGPADVVYVTGSSAAIRATAEAGTLHSVVAGIEAGMFSDDRLPGVLGKLDLIITNSAGWTALTENAKCGVTTVETQGADGAVIHAAGSPDRRVRAVPVEAVDTTGAGDCFAGAVCHYLASGIDLAAACQLAVAAAALSTRAIGPQSALPTDAEVRASAAEQHPVLRSTPEQHT